MPYSPDVADGLEANFAPSGNRTRSGGTRFVWLLGRGHWRRGEVDFEDFFWCGEHLDDAVVPAIVAAGAVIARRA